MEVSGREDVVKDSSSSSTMASSSALDLGGTSLSHNTSRKKAHDVNKKGGERIMCAKGPGLEIRKDKVSTNLNGIHSRLLWSSYTEL